jgi:hypothetical protein
MRKIILILITIMIILMILSVIPAAASSPPANVMFEVQTTIPEGGPNHGPFVATGPAVDEGIVCASGETTDVGFHASGFQSDKGVNYQVVKLFVCDDGSGEFSAKLQVRADRRGDNYNWNIVGGTGSYEKLHGTGTGTGLPTPDGVFDIFDGKLHID